MATDGSFMSEDQFMCSICLDVFTEPVSIPCGHNFCKACISLHWKDKELCKCPLCNEKFKKGLKLCVNTAFREVVENFKKQNVKQNESVKPGQVACDCCLSNKSKASKTCLVCLTSFCETHLQPHREVAALKRHKLTNPVRNLEAKICKKHNRILELFCWNDQVNICALCTEHSGHLTVPLDEAQVEKTALMGKKKAEAQRAKQRSEKKNKRSKTQATWKAKNEATKVFFRLVPEHMGFSEGRFCYAVELSGGSNWVLGVVRESLLRKKELDFDPKNGSWIIRLGDKCDCTPSIKDSVTFYLKKKPERVVVCVDYEKGLVIFCDSDTNDQIFYFAGCEFNEKLVLFCGEMAEGWVQNLQMRVKNMTFADILLGFFLMVIFLISLSQNLTSSAWRTDGTF